MFVVWLLCLVIYNVIWSKEYQIPPLLWMLLIPFVLHDLNKYLEGRPVISRPTVSFKEENGDTTIEGTLISMNGGDIPPEVLQAAKEFARKQVDLRRKQKEEPRQDH